MAIDGFFALSFSVGSCAAAWPDSAVSPADEDLVDADRPVDILDLLLAEILVGDIQPLPDLIAHRGRDADAAGFGDQLRGAPPH